MSNNETNLNIVSNRSCDSYAQINWPVVGIGASAGGLEALTQMVQGVDIGTDSSFVIMQHLSPHYRSMMVQLLGRDTSIAVQEIHDRENLKRDIIYVAPPNYNVIVKNGQFQLLEPPQQVKPKPSVDIFFKSLADELGELAIGVILSGTGSDGALGCKAIKSSGGTIIVQEPEDAKYDGMPNASIEAGVADLVVPAYKIPEHIQSLTNLSKYMVNAESDDKLEKIEISRLLNLIKKHIRIDFSGYKESTIRRRIHRRMMLRGSTHISDYIEGVEQHHEELNFLVKEILVSVTSFFRDRDAFEALAKVLEALIEDKNNGEELRIWVSGCATGEEAYSIAMLALDIDQSLGKNLKIQVFATDIDNNAIEVARKGAYPATSLTEIKPTLAKQYILNHTTHIEANKKLRDAVIFARQDLVLDPPFMNMDLISCRNVLIYFTQQLQAKVLSIFYQALNTNGYLFLGRSENVSQQQDNFVPAAGKWRIFQPTGGKHKSLASAMMRDPLRRAKSQPVKKVRQLETTFQAAMLSLYGPAAVLVNENMDILHSHGDLEKLLQFASGNPNLNLLHLVRSELKTDVQVQLHQAKKNQQIVRGRARKLKGLGNKKPTRVVVFPVTEYFPDNYYLVCFESVSRTKKEVSRESGISKADIEAELYSTREHLQTLNEELETSNEEMQALTEELQASNEELQASNEEMEASNEELQATNEELISLNQEMIQKSKDLALLNADFENVNNSLSFPLLVLDKHLAIKNLNQAAMITLKLPFSIRGQNLDALALTAPFDTINSQAKEVIQHSRPYSTIVSDQQRHYDIEFTPCMTSDGQVSGVIVALIDNHELYNAKQKAINATERLHNVFNHSKFFIAVKNIQGIYQYINSTFLQVFELNERNVLGKTDFECLPENLAQTFNYNELRVIREKKSTESNEEIKINGTSRSFRITRFPVFNTANKVESLCIQGEEITEKLQAEEQLRLAAKVFHRSGEGILITDENAKIITVNEAFSKVTGYKAEDVIGKNPSILSSGKHDKNFYEQMWQTIHSDGWWQGDVWNRRKNGEIYPEWLTINVVKDDEHKLTNYVAIFSDVSVVKESQRRIEYLASHDELTGLPNRSLFMDRLKHALAGIKRKNGHLVLMFIDLDNFKTINDTLGHDVGDILLNQAGERLIECVREGDTLARLGGDEFTILLENTNYAEAEPIAQRIIDYLTASFKINGNDLYISASIGLSVYPMDGIDSNTLLKHADTAMYRAKEQGKNQICSFTSEMKVIAQQRLALESGLRQEIQEQGKNFQLVYQPIIDLNSEKIIGAEALLRWQTKHLGNVSPEVFIPMAEQSGLIIDVSKWVCSEAFQTLMEITKLAIDYPVISINFSGKHFSKGDVLELLDIMQERYCVDPQLICLELTEGSLMEHSNTVISILTQIRNRGYSISIDDFGTGYSSLSYLKRYPISNLKVDRSFVNGLGQDEDDKAISSAIIKMAQALGMRVIAEGVETELQLDELKKMECDAAQGYYYFRPIPKKDFISLLEQQNKP